MVGFFVSQCGVDYERVGVIVGRSGGGVLWGFTMDMKHYKVMPLSERRVMFHVATVMILITYVLFLAVIMLLAYY